MSRKYHYWAARTEPTIVIEWSLLSEQRVEGINEYVKHHSVSKLRF